MSTKRNPAPSKRNPASTKRTAAIAAAAALLARRRFARRLYGTLTILTLLAGGLTAANLSKMPHPNSTSELARSSTTAAFALYTLHRETGKDNAGVKKPDTIRGTSLSGSDEGTAIVSAPRIQEYAALPSALAVVTLNDDNTSSLEIASLAGGPPTLVPLPSLGTVANLHVAGSKHLIGFTFTGSSATDQHWKTLFVYDIDTPSSAPQAVQGINGAVSAADWRFVPGTATLVAQTDDRTMFLIDALSTGKVSPLGTHAGILGFVPGTNELAVSDPGLKVGTDPPRYSTINLATGTLTALTLAGTLAPDTAKGGTTSAGQPVVLDGSGQYAQVVRKYDAGKEASVVTLTDKSGSHVLYEPDAAWSRLLDVCVSPASDYLAVETAAPQYLGDQYPVRPEPSPMRTDVVDLKSGAVLKSVAGFLPSWCG
jgi:hypothetical protein